MNVAQLIAEIKTKQSYLCVGLDTDITKLPDGITKDATGILQFNKEIIDATKDFAVSYKINTAFYEQLGSEGWRVLEKTRELIPSNILSIADAKRGDIGNTSTMYAKAFFETMDFDALTRFTRCNWFSRYDMFLYYLYYFYRFYLGELYR